MMPGGMQPGQMNSGDPTQQDQTAAQYPSGVQPGQPVQFQPGQPGQQYPYSSGQPGQSVPFGQIGQPGQPYPNAPGTQTGQPSYGQVPGQPPYGPGTPGLPNLSSGFNPSTPTQSGSYLQSPPVPGNTINQQQPPGAGPGSTPVPGMIRDMLTQGRSQATFGISGQTIGGGIAGVATKFEAQGIKLYNDRAKYNEWEFVYDPRKDMTNPMMSGPQLGTQPQLGNSPQTGFQPSPTSPGPK
jgi:hypothetical protein